MNRYPLWKYALLAVAMLIGLLYTLPNFYGEAPAVQVSSGKATVRVEAPLAERVRQVLTEAGINADFVQFEGNSVRARFTDTDTQIRAKDAIAAALNPVPDDPSYIVALNLISRSPEWMTRIGALPMYLGLDLRGGVHFLMQVDMEAALTRRAEGLAGDARTLLRERNVRHGGVVREGQTLIVRTREAAVAEQARQVLGDAIATMQWQTAGSEAQGDLRLVGRFTPEAARDIQQQALRQNITTLGNRVNELGVAEPVIQQQGLDRVVVQLPGVQDTAKAKDIIGRTATLEIRLVNESAEARAAERGEGPVPFGSERFVERDGSALIVLRDVVLTGENLTDAQPGFDSQTQEPTVNLVLDARGSRVFREVTRENVGRRMAIILFERGRGEVVTAPVIRTEIGGGRVQISGRLTVQEAADQSLLLRAGSLAAPMEIIEERTIGPSLGADNIARGFNSVQWGLLAIAIFICAYYALFGVFSTIALTFNLLLLIALLSMLQATLTLPGMAAIALTLGMAIDANVLINERVREELRAGAPPQMAIQVGYERAWNTILDANVTTLIAGVALLAFGSGPVRGFAVVHVLGILTSMFSAVVFSRGLVNLWYGRQKKLKSLSIGTIWKPPADSPLGRQLQAFSAGGRAPRKSGTAAGTTAGTAAGADS
jgi:preprotein translocase subunit SecD